ncbi:MAG: hypothetical protein K2W96_08540 [Gemmataceae bacterium]|nr:hypothetical protein [Gemmataceae bacterium]
MIPHPTAVGLTLCDNSIIERGTNKRTTVGSFSRLAFLRFPATAPSFFAVATLVGGSGEGIAELILTRLDTGEELHSVRGPVRFSDRLNEVHCHSRLASLVFPAPGAYQFTLLIDGQWVAQKRLVIARREG